MEPYLLKVRDAAIVFLTKNVEDIWYRRRCRNVIVESRILAARYG